MNSENPKVPKKVKTTPQKKTPLKVRLAHTAKIKGQSQTSEKTTLKSLPKGLQKQSKSTVIESHPQKKEIIDALCHDVSLTAISKKYGISKNALFLYREKNLIGPVMQERLERYRSGEEIIDRNEKLMKNAERMLLACDEYLRDPDNPEKYDLGPRAWEVDIVYKVFDVETERPIRKKENLQRLIDRMFENGMEAVEVYFKIADPRRLLLEASENLRQALEFNAKILKVIEDKVTVNQNLHIYLPAKRDDETWNITK